MNFVLFSHFYINIKCDCFTFAHRFQHRQVECKKAQPKEVMLPTNLAKTRASGRTAYGELVVLSGGPSTVGAPSSLRYAPYPLPASISGIQHHHHHHHQQQQQQQYHHQPLQQQHGVAHHQTAHIIATPAAPSILQYSPSPQQTLYDTAAALSYKRLLAATATASLRSHPHHAHQIPSTTAAAAQATATPRATATLSYPLSELLGLQPLDMSRTFFL